MEGLKDLKELQEINTTEVKEIKEIQFHMGSDSDKKYGRVLNKNIKNKEKKKFFKAYQRQVQIQKQKKDSSIPQTLLIQFLAPIFNILPHRLFHRRILFALSTVSTSIVHQYESLYNVNNPPFKRYSKGQNAQNAVPTNTEDPLNAFWSPQFQEAFRTAMEKISKARGIFRRFLHKWRTTRLKFMNTEDIFTSDPPKHPIFIADWTTQQVWQFEASTLMRDITTRLQHHDGFFEDPQVPRNPYTNIPLTQSQAISVWNQLSKSPATASSWFTNYRQCRWQMKKFVEEYKVPIQLHAFRTTMRNMKHIDTHDRILDFIQYAYLQGDTDCYYRSYKYSLTHYPDHRLLLKWRDLCLRYYESGIVHYANPDLLYKIQESILSETRRLLPLQYQLIRLRNLELTRFGQNLGVYVLFDV